MFFYFVSIQSHAQEANDINSGNIETFESDSLESASPKKGKLRSYFNQVFKGHIDRTYEKKLDLSFVASPSYTQEGSFGIGGLASGLYRLDRTDSMMPPSDVSIVFNASLNGFYTFGFNGNNYFKGNKSRLSYKVLFSTKNLDFWGITYNACDVNPKIGYTRREIKGEADYVYKMTDDFYLGATLDVRYTKANDMDDYSYLQGEKDAYTFAGAGITIQYDSRDFIPNPKRGMYLMLQEVIFPQALGSFNKTLHRTTLTADFFQPVWKGGLLALDLYGQFNPHNAPWTMKEELGSGGRRMRGYYSGRYIDSKMVTSQLELRQHIYNRVGLTAWGGGGTVFPSFDEFQWDNVLPNYGIGFRWEFKHNLNLRIDYGLGKGASGIVLNMGEAF